MKRVYSILMVFCLMFSLLGNTALASEPFVTAELKNAEANTESNAIITVSGNSTGTWDNAVSSGDAMPQPPPIKEEEAEVVMGTGELTPDGAEEGTPPEVTRIQWLHELTELFEMSVTKDNYPDNYYSDMNTESEYYYDVMLATEFGLIDTPAGEAFMPQEAATREFAARTLNLCLGYVLEDKSYTYAEASEATYPDDIQIAVNRGWFQLKNGAFLPQQPITTAEKDLMLQDARTVRESQSVDQDYNGSYQFVSDVIVIPEGTRVELTDEEQLTIYDCPVTLRVGDKFAVIPDGFPVVHRVAQIATAGDRTVITFSSVDTKDAFVSLDVQGNQSADLAQIQAIDETVEINYIVGGTEEKDWEDGEKLETLELVGDREISAVEITQEYDIPDHVREEFEIAPGVKLKLVCKISDINYDYKASSTGVYVGLNAKVSLQCNLNADIREAMGYEKSITLIKIPVGCLGFLTSSIDVSLGGKVTFSMAEKISMGVQYNWGQGFRLVKDFQKESFTIQIEAKASICANLSWKVNYGVVKGNIYGKVGMQARISFKKYTDGKSPSECVDVGAWLFATYGCEIKVDLFLVNAEWEKELKVYDEKNSPVRVYFHFDNGKSVTECGRDSAEEGGSDGGTGSGTGGKKYYTPINSQYGYSGINSGTTAEGEPYAIFEYSLDKDGNATITKYNGNMSALSIPDTLDGHAVVGIGSKVFAGNTRLRIVVIPDSVTSIKEGAFGQCSNLSSVTLSKSLETIGAHAFYNCDRLAAIEIPKSLKLTTSAYIYEFAYDYQYGPFYGCDGLKNITFEKGTTKIPNGLFANCPGIEQIVIPDSVTAIGENAFFKCVNLREIKLSDNLTEMGELAFAYCRVLEEICIPDSVKSIAEGAFGQCSNLSSVTLSKSLETIGAHAFYNCDRLAAIEIPKSLKLTTSAYIYEFAYDYQYGPFYGCDGLKNIAFEKGTTKIPNGLFANCPGIERIVIPDTVTVIESKAFYKCTNLKEIVIPGSVAEIKGSAFDGCAMLQNITIPNTVTTIGESAFSNCSSLQKAVLSNQMTGIPTSAFENCTSLTEIHISDTVTDIGNSAFRNCTALAKATIGDKVKSIGSYAFNNCDALTTISLPDSVTSLGTYAFADCELLSEVKLGTGITKIPSYAFNLCPSLQKIVLPYRLTEMENNAFTNCTGLTEIVIPRSVAKIADNVFGYPAKMTIYGISGTYA